MNVPCNRLIYHSIEEVKNIADIIIKAKAGSELEPKSGQPGVAETFGERQILLAVSGI